MFLASPICLAPLRSQLAKRAEELVDQTIEAPPGAGSAAAAAPAGQQQQQAAEDDHSDDECSSATVLAAEGTTEPGDLCKCVQ